MKKILFLTTFIITFFLLFTLSKQQSFAQYCDAGAFLYNECTGCNQSQSVCNNGDCSGTDVCGTQSDAGCSDWCSCGPDTYADCTGNVYPVGGDLCLGLCTPQPYGCTSAWQTSGSCAGEAACTYDWDCPGGTTCRPGACDPNFAGEGCGFFNMPAGSSCECGGTCDGGGNCTGGTGCCVANQGASCNANSCGDGGGTINCDGSCSAGQEPERSGWNSVCAASSAPNSCGDVNDNLGSNSICGPGTSVLCDASVPAAPAERAGYGAACTAYSVYNSCNQRTSANGVNICAAGGGVTCNATTPTAPPCVKSLTVKEDTTQSGVAAGTYGQSGRRSTEGGSNNYNTLTITLNTDSIAANGSNVRLVGMAFTSPTSAPANQTLFELTKSAYLGSGFVLLYAQTSETKIYYNAAGGTSSSSFVNGNYYVYFKGTWNNIVPPFGTSELTVEVGSGSLPPSAPQFSVTLYQAMTSKKWATHKYILDSSNTETRDQNPACNSALGSTCTGASLPLASAEKNEFDIVLNYFKTLLAIR